MLFCMLYYSDNLFIIRVTRICNKTSVVGDVTIPKGAMIDVPIYMLQHLPEYWEEPEEFIPERLACYLWSHCVSLKSSS